MFRFLVSDMEASEKPARTALPQEARSATIRWVE